MMQILGAIFSLITGILKAIKDAVFNRGIDQGTEKIDQSKSEEDDIDGLKKLRDASFPKKP